MNSIKDLLQLLHNKQEYFNENMTPGQWQQFVQELRELSPGVDGALQSGQSREQMRAYFQLLRVLRRYPAVRGAVPGAGSSMWTDTPSVQPTDEPVKGLPVQPVKQKLIDIVREMDKLPASPPTPAPEEPPSDA